MPQHPDQLRGEINFQVDAFNPKNPAEPVLLKVDGEELRYLRNSGQNHRYLMAGLIKTVVQQPWRVYEGIRDDWIEELQMDPEDCLCYIAKPDINIARSLGIYGIDDTRYLFVFANPRKVIFRWRTDRGVTEKDLATRFRRKLWPAD